MPRGKPKLKLYTGHVRFHTDTGVELKLEFTIKALGFVSMERAIMPMLYRAGCPWDERGYTVGASWMYIESDIGDELETQDLVLKAEIAGLSPAI